MRKSIIILLVITISGLIVPLTNYYAITYLTEDRIFNSFARIPDFKYVLVFGSGRTYSKGSPNYSFISRIEAAEQLGSKAGIQFIILSGRNNPPHYNETQAMQSALAGKVEISKIMIDSNGLNTLTSLNNYYRSNQKKPVILISEKAHLERALYYADHIGIDAVGYTKTEFGSTISFREVLARMKATLDILTN